jgi:hypothetical protein
MLQPIKLVHHVFLHNRFETGAHRAQTVRRSTSLQASRANAVALGRCQRNVQCGGSLGFPNLQNIA